MPSADPSPGAIMVRLATPDDGPACARIYRPYVEDGAASFELRAPSGAEMADRVRRILERSPWLVAEVDGTVRGYAYGGRHRERPAYDWTTETTVYVDQAYVGRGLGHALMTALLEILALQGFHLVVAGITLPNAGSVGLHEALGFRPIGRFPGVGWKGEAWHDTGWYALELGTRAAAPAAITPLAEAMARWADRRR